MGIGGWEYLKVHIPVTQENAADLGQELKLAQVNYISAVSIPFKKELGVPFPGLLTLGVRIELAARDNDPVGLIATGLELKAAETAAGKTAANYKADDVIKRGFDMAVLRSDVTELKGVKALLPDKAETIDKAIKVAEARKNEETRTPPRTIFVENYLDERLAFVVDGRIVGYVEPSQNQIKKPNHSNRRKFTFHIPAPVDIEIRSADDGRILWEHRDVGYGSFFVRIPPLPDSNTNR
ncbi:hypothetical protein FACS189443_2220 [Planctomycetales bacterium]|nr:hypothetical protein FACS189443_2220 [Planctomycetales bacterium]